MSDYYRYFVDEYYPGLVWRVNTNNNWTDVAEQGKDNWAPSLVQAIDPLNENHNVEVEQP